MFRINTHIINNKTKVIEKHIEGSGFWENKMYIFKVFVILHISKGKAIS